MVLNAMAYQLAVIDEHGILVITNQAWRAFRQHHQIPGDGSGQHYRDVFSLKQGVGGDHGERLREGVHAVLTGSLARFQHCYRQELAEQSWWLELTVTPFPTLFDGQRVVLLSQRDVTQEKMLETDLLKQANSDDLTGLANRRFFLFQGRQMLCLAKRHHWPATLIYLDLDNFKFINDHYGHKVGDEVLIQVATSLQQRARESDVIARLGGDEFAMLFLNVARKDTAHLVRAYQESLPQSPIIVQGSFGIAHFPKDGGTLDDLLVHADQIMYRVKMSRYGKQGRLRHKNQLKGIGP